MVPDGTPIPLKGDAPAVSGQDFTPVSGTLIFDDFEMSKTILIPIVDDGGQPRPNRDFSIVLYNPQRDPTESTAVSAPRLDAIDSQALIRILDADLDPRGNSRSEIVVTNIDMVAMTTNVFTNTTVSLNSTNAIFNFLKANYRVPEDASDYWGTTPITVYVNRSGTNIDTASIFYRINSTFLNSQISQGNNEFPLQPGSDYATPDFGGGNTGVSGGVEGRQPIDFTGSDNGTLTWGAKDFDPKPITFAINNDNVTEFNEDFHISLYDVINQASVPVGMINETTVTIMFDDEDPPAGSVDQFYNPDFSLDLVPPIKGNPVGSEPRQHPGTDTQGQVNALVVQSDDKTIIGGDFTSYNGTQRHGIVRINTSGELDPSFDPGDGINLVAGDFVSALGIQADGKIVVAGSFTSFNGQSCGNIIRLNTNGTIDTSFRLTAGSGANGTVRSIAIRGDGKIIMGGDFTLFNGTARKYVARLNGDGTIDSGYSAGDALNGPVYALGPKPGITIAVSAASPNGNRKESIISTSDSHLDSSR